MRRNSRSARTCSATAALLALFVSTMGCVGAPLPPVSDAGLVGDASTLDPCASDGSPLDTLGCNGFASDDPAPNQMGGVCTGATGATLASCEVDAMCVGRGGTDQGRCQPVCDPAATLFSTGGCPTGYRCWRFGAPTSLCFRDRDAQHACPSGLACEGGRCMEPTP